MALLFAGLIFLALALAGSLAGRLRQSAIPVYILVGLLLRPWVHETEMVAFFGQLGLILLMFFLGLEFSLPELLAAPGRTFRIGTVDAAVNFPLGFAIALLFGWGLLPALALGTALYISSSAIVAKSVIDLQRTANPETEIALRVLVFEDLAVAILLGILVTASAAGEGPPWARAGLALGFVAGAVVLGLWGRRWHARVLDVRNDDLFVLTVLGFTLLVSWTSEAAGLSDAIGAFVAGLWVAETPARERARMLLAPFYGPLAAFFFFAFGTMVDPSGLERLGPLALLLLALGIFGKMLSAWWIGRSEELSRRATLTLGLTLIPRGEFSIVVAGTVAHALEPDLMPLVALVVLGLSAIGSAALYAAPTITRRLTGEGVVPDAAAFRAETAERAARETPSAQR